MRLGGAWTTFRGKRLKDRRRRPGRFERRGVEPAATAIVSAVCASSPCSPRGRRPMPFDDFARGSAPHGSRGLGRAARRVTDRTTRATSSAIDDQRSPGGLPLPAAHRPRRRVRQPGAASELGRSRLSERDRGFVTELVYGTTRMRRGLRCADRSLRRQASRSPTLRTLLRLGAYQLHFAGVPAHAAVGETVELAPKRGPRVRQRGPAPRRRHADGVADRRRPAELSRLDRRPPQTRAGRRGASRAMARMNEPAPVSVRDDGYMQDLASQWVAAAVEARAGGAGARRVRGTGRQGDGDGRQRRVRGRRRPAAAPRSA